MTIKKLIYYLSQFPEDATVLSSEEGNEYEITENDIGYDPINNTYIIG